jgi:nicotinamide phosphoribosyltransferase
VRRIRPVTTNTDFYKIDHVSQYPKDAEYIYSTWIPRGSRLEGVDQVVLFGLQAWLMKVHDYFNENFFNRPKEEVIAEYVRTIKFTLGVKNPKVAHWEALHDVGYLPIQVYALDEGTLTPLRVPQVTIENTLPGFLWLVGFLETWMSLELWKPCTNATIAFQFRKIFEKYANETVGDTSFVPFQGHDFSMRGMDGLEPAESSGAAHLLNFVGTDTINAIHFHEEFYGANMEKELIGTSVYATEHSVMCVLGHDERAAFKRLLTETYPSGIFSAVSDTWDFWNVVENILPSLKPEIMARDGKMVIRPDSGNPADIICGLDIEDTTNYCINFEDFKHYMKNTLVSKVRDETPHGEHGEYEIEEIFKYEGKYYKMQIQLDWNRYDKQFYFIDGHKISKFEEVVPTSEQLGLIECLWNTFGGTITEKGYKLLDSHIGAIYGDSINLQNAPEILERLKKKGFASTNLVFGIGSFTYQYSTRDTFYFALKATMVERGGKEIKLQKDPKTDSGIKKSLTGRVIVVEKDGKMIAIDNLTMEQQHEYEFVNLLKPVYEDGIFFNKQTLRQIRDKLESYL